MAGLKRNLLAVSWAMPPLVYPRSIQVSRSLKELSRRGWSIDVVAVDPLPDSAEVHDSDFAALYCDYFRVHRIRTQDVVKSGRQRWPLNYRSSFLRWLYPDLDPPAAIWMSRARSSVFKLLRSTNSAALVTFAQPWTDHLIGLSVKRRFRSLPWVAHFSDPWVDGPYSAQCDPQLLRRWRDQERQVIELSDAIVFVNDRTAALVMRKYPIEWQTKVYIVPHGFDLDLLTSIPVNDNRHGRPRIVYTGSMFAGHRDPVKVLKALARLKTKLPIDRLPLVEFVGSKTDVYEQTARELGIDGLVSFGDRMGYLDALAIASRADILLLIDTNMDESVFFPSKLVDYLMLNKPILALTSQSGATADVLRPLGHICIDSADPDAIAQAMIESLDRLNTADNESVRDSWKRDEYHIAKTTDRLERAVMSAVQGRRAAD